MNIVLLRFGGSLHAIVGCICDQICEKGSDLQHTYNLPTFTVKKVEYNMVFPVAY